MHRRDPAAPKRSKRFVFWTTFRFLQKNLMRSAPERHKRFGYAGINFGEPISTREHCLTNGVDFSALERADRFHEVERLADRLMDCVSRVIPVLPVPLVAAVFHRDPETWMDSFKIKIRVHRTFHELQRRGAPIREDEMPLERTIMRAVSMLHHRGLIHEEDEAYRANPESLELLEFHANSLAHWLDLSAPSKDGLKSTEAGAEVLRDRPLPA